MVGLGIAAAIAAPLVIERVIEIPPFGLAVMPDDAMPVTTLGDEMRKQWAAYRRSPYKDVSDHRPWELRRVGIYTTSLELHGGGNIHRIDAG